MTAQHDHLNVFLTNFSLTLKLLGIDLKFQVQFLAEHIRLSSMFGTHVSGNFTSIVHLVVACATFIRPNPSMRHEVKPQTMSVASLVVALIAGEEFLVKVSITVML